MNALSNDQLFIPKGFAHGFYVLSKTAKINYKVDNPYSKKHERSLNVKDPFFSINFNHSQLNISNKDLNAPFLNELKMSDFDFK